MHGAVLGRGKKKKQSLIVDTPIIVHFAVDGGWSAWKDWEAISKCTVLCGGGKKNKTRDRTCTNPAPQYGGADCTGESRQNRTFDCNVEECGGN